MAESLPLYIVLATGVPEIFFSLLLSFRLFNDTIHPKHALLVSVIASFINYLIRSIGVVFGIHTMFTTVAIVIVCFILTKKNIWKITSVAVCGVAFLLFIEVIEVQIAVYLNLTFDLLTGKLMIVFVKVIVMSLLLLLVIKTKFSLFNSSFLE
jgi:hypothetical protein